MDVGKRKVTKTLVVENSEGVSYEFTVGEIITCTVVSRKEGLYEIADRGVFKARRIKGFSERSSG